MQNRVLGHAVRFAELLDFASVVTVKHLRAETRAVGAGMPGVILVT